MWLISILALFFPLPEGHDLTPLCDDNYSTHLKAITNAILFFKTDACPHCRNLLPSMKMEARRYQHRGFFGILDVKKCPKAAEFYQVREYPTVLFVRNGEFQFKRQQNQKLRDFIRKRLSPPWKHVWSFEAVQEATDRNKSFFLIDHDLSPPEEQILEVFIASNLTFLSIDSFNSSPFKFESKIVYYRNADRQFVEVGDELSESAINQFLVNGTRPAYHEFLPDQVGDLVDEENFMILVKFETPKNSFGNREYLLLTSLTGFNLPLFYFSSEQSQIFADIFHPPDDQETVVGVVRIVDDQVQRWIHTGDHDKAQDFVASVLKGDVPQYFKSEEKPLDNSGPVKKIVASIYHEIVIESKLPCILLLYSAENYALQAQMERLNEAATELQGQAIFGHLNTETNEIPLTIPSELPAFVAIGQGWVKHYGKEVKVSLIEWIKTFLPSEL
jgi:hypothetical protein